MQTSSISTGGIISNSLKKSDANITLQLINISIYRTKSTHFKIQIMFPFPETQAFDFHFAFRIVFYYSSYNVIVVPSNSNGSWFMVHVPMISPDFPSFPQRSPSAARRCTPRPVWGTSISPQQRARHGKSLVFTMKNGGFHPILTLFMVPMMRKFLTKNHGFKDV